MKKLPKEIKCSIFDILDNCEANDLCDLITDWLSDKYGFCVNSYYYDIKVNLSDIDWDTTE